MKQELDFALSFMGKRGPKPVAPESLYAFAHQLYWDFRLLAEGSYRWIIDKKKHNQLIVEAQKAQLDDEQKSRLKQRAEKEVRAGRLKEEQKEGWLRDIEESELLSTREWLHFLAAHEARKQLKIPGEPDVVKRLLQARTAEQVRRICKDASVTREVEIKPGQTKGVVVRNWPISPGSVLPYYLSEYASQFITAKSSRRFPRSDRPSNRLRQLWFLSRALAGAIFGVKTRTAINLVGSKRPEQIFEESRAAKPTRKKRGKK